MKRFIAIFTALLLLFLMPAVMAADVQDAESLLNAYSADELLQLHSQVSAALRENGSYPYSELKKGNTGYEVFFLQTELAALEYYKKTIVDEFGNGTYNALRAFEKDNDLKVNGVASAQDQQLIYQKAAALLENIPLPLDEPYNAYTPDELLALWEQIGVALRNSGQYPYEELQKGNVGYEVTLLQKRLAELGYYQKTVVDIFGNGTYNAVRAFEKAHGLKVNGIASSQDQQLVFSTDAKVYEKPATTVSHSNSSSPDASSSATP